VLPVNSLWDFFSSQKMLKALDIASNPNLDPVATWCQGLTYLHHIMQIENKKHQHQMQAKHESKADERLIQSSHENDRSSEIDLKMSFEQFRQSMMEVVFKRAMSGKPHGAYFKLFQECFIELEESKFDYMKVHVIDADAHA